MMLTVMGRFLRRSTCYRSGEQGWALLGLLLALSVMSIVLVSAIVPNVQKQVQREKEAEMIYRGEQMAQGIARYYGRGALTPIQLLVPPPYGYLTDLTKIRDGITIGVREIKLVRQSATIDPMISSDWEPVRARDPRIMKFLQQWAAQTLSQIPSQYLLIAGPPQTSVFKKTDPTVPKSAAEGVDQGKPTPPSLINPSAPQAKPPAQKPEDGDDDDDDDDELNDPLAHLFEKGTPGKSNAPIVGVAPTKKGKASSAYFGLENYDDWVFIYIPRNLQPNGGIQRPIPGGIPGGAPGGQPVRPPAVLQ
jgi:type II secretory pathway pseudopilin PulG